MNGARKKKMNNMKILKGNFGECRFIDNMDPEHGLPSLEEKSWDLCLTDPPYGVNYKKASGLGEKQTSKDRWKKKILYSDSMPREEYYSWCLRWGNECRNKCLETILTPGNLNLAFWIKEFDPYDIMIWHKKNSQAGGRAYHFLRHEFLLILDKPKQKFKTSVLNIYVINGFLRETEYLHPCPKSINLWKFILKQYNPKSVLDPFLGSGTTAQVCEHLGIPWLGYEIMEEYAPDIEKRIQKGIEDHKYYKPQKKQTQTKLI